MSHIPRSLFLVAFALVAGCVAEADSASGKVCTESHPCPDGFVCTPSSDDSGVCVAEHCTATRDCPGGFICSDGSCLAVCVAHDECAEGQLCTDGLCTENGAPRIASVVGNGSDRCPASPGGRCFTNGLTIRGHNLRGSEVELRGSTSWTLARTPDDPGSVDEARVRFPNGLQQGGYTLVVMNAAGRDQVDVSILQGEPGSYTAGVGIVIEDDTIRVDFGAAAGQVADGAALGTVTAQLGDAVSRLDAAEEKLIAIDQVDGAFQLSTGEWYVPAGTDAAANGDRLQAVLALQSDWPDENTLEHVRIRLAPGRFDVGTGSLNVTRGIILEGAGSTWVGAGEGSTVIEGHGPGTTLILAEPTRPFVYHQLRGLSIWRTGGTSDTVAAVELSRGVVVDCDVHVEVAATAIGIRVIEPTSIGVGVRLVRTHVWASGTTAYGVDCPDDDVAVVDSEVNATGETCTGIHAEGVTADRSDITVGLCTSGGTAVVQSDSGQYTDSRVFGLNAATTTTFHGGYLSEAHLVSGQLRIVAAEVVDTPTTDTGTVTCLFSHNLYYETLAVDCTPQ